LKEAKIRKRFSARISSVVNIITVSKNDGHLSPGGENSSLLQPTGLVKNRVPMLLFLTKNFY
jgi:hypothetical protein